MRRALAPFSKLKSSNHTQSSADFITNTSGFSFRYTQAALRQACFEYDAKRRDLELKFETALSQLRELYLAEVSNIQSGTA